MLNANYLFVVSSFINLDTMNPRNLDKAKSHNNPIPYHFEADQFTSSEADIKQEFSFNREMKKNNEHSLKQKYLDIYNDLKSMSCEDLIDLLLEELDENQKYKHQISYSSNRINGLEQQLSEFRDQLKKKREAIELLCETESKHLQLIEKLQNKISKKGDYGRDTHYEKKYQELSVYMSEYIRNINLAQDEFKRAYSTLKGENMRLVRQVEDLNSELTQTGNKAQIQTQKWKRIEQEVVQLNQNKRRLCQQIGMLTDQNEILRKQIEVYQENIRITDRLEAHFSHENNQLSSDLDFIRQKICENQSISKDIIERFQENSSANFEKVNRVKELVLDSLQNFQSKNLGLERQMQNLRKENSSLKNEIETMKKQFEYVLEQKQSLNEDLGQQRVQKEGIKRELIGLSEKVKTMESTYRKQIEQSQKIKGELFKFWQNKEKKEVRTRELSPRVLGQIKVNNCEFSQSTLSNSQKQSKISIWQKKSFHESSSHIFEKQNLPYISQDSLCN